jgi:RNA polymerase subunit RPABC4/transcription elongation factor Spt4
MAEEEKLSPNQAHCKHCGAIISLSAKTCPKCGDTDPITLAEISAAGKRGMAAAKEAKLEEEKLRAAGEYRCRHCKKIVKITAETCPHCGIKSPGNTPMGQVIAIVSVIFLLGIIGVGQFVGQLIVYGPLAFMNIGSLFGGIFGVVCLGIGIFVVGWIIKTKKKIKAMQSKA